MAPAGPLASSSQSRRKGGQTDGQTDGCTVLKAKTLVRGARAHPEAGGQAWPFPCTSRAAPQAGAPKGAPDPVLGPPSRPQACTRLPAALDARPSSGNICISSGSLGGLRWVRTVGREPGEAVVDSRPVLRGARPAPPLPRPSSRPLPPRPAPPLLPVAQDLRVGRGLTRKDDTLALLHRLGLNRQSHRRRVCKAEDSRSGSFLSLKFLLSL